MKEKVNGASDSSFGLKTHGFTLLITYEVTRPMINAYLTSLTKNKLPGAHTISKEELFLRVKLSEDGILTFS